MKYKLIIFTMYAVAIGALARDFGYNGLAYTVLDEGAATCTTLNAPYWTSSGGPVMQGNYASGELVIPEVVYDSEKAYTVTEIGRNGFYNNSDLTKVTLPNTITKIGGGAFSLCRKLKSINLPNSITVIESNAFFPCGLTSVVIPDNIQVLEEDCFVSLTSVFYGADELVEASRDVFYSKVYGEAILYVKESALEQARTVQPWCNFTYIKAFDFDGVEEVADVIDTEYFDMQGLSVGDTYKGLVLKVQTLANGQKQTEKVLLK